MIDRRMDGEIDECMDGWIDHNIYTPKRNSAYFDNHYFYLAFTIKLNESVKYINAQKKKQLGNHTYADYNLIKQEKHN